MGAYCLLSCSIYMLLLCHTTDKQRDKQNNGQTDGHTPEMTDRRNDRQSDRQTKSYTCTCRQAERKTEEPLVMELYI